MSHAHDHDDHQPAAHGYGSSRRALEIGIALNLGFVLLEAGAGLWAGSLALLADAGHNLADVLGLVLAWLAVVLSARPPSRRRSYGWGRTTILAALANAVLLLIAVGAIAVEAARRLIEPAPVAGWTVVAVAAAGIVVNGLTSLWLWRDSAHDLNMRGAFLHMVADAAVSAGVVGAALAMMATGLLWLDPLVSLVIALVIALSAWGLLRRSLDLALDAVPQGVDQASLDVYLRGLPGVTAVHDLHVWPLSTTTVALTAHLVRPAHGLDDAFLESVRTELGNRFGIAHATLQIEAGTGACGCILAGPEAEPAPRSGGLAGVG